jgi:hypothetical protein
MLPNGTTWLCRTTQTEGKAGRILLMVPVEHCGSWGLGAMTVRAQAGGFLLATREYRHDLIDHPGLQAGPSGACRPRRSTGNVPVGGFQP